MEWVEGAREVGGEAIGLEGHHSVVVCAIDLGVFCEVRWENGKASRVSFEQVHVV